MDYLEELEVQMNDLIENTANRVPICIVVDTSLSMAFDKRMENVNKGIREFIDNSADDEYAVDSLDLCIIDFEGDGAKVEYPFTNVRKMKEQFSPLRANGQTPLGKAVELALHEIAGVMARYTS